MRKDTKAMVKAGASYSRRGQDEDIRQDQEEGGRGRGEQEEGVSVSQSPPPPKTPSPPPPPPPHHIGYVVPSEGRVGTEALG